LATIPKVEAELSELRVTILLKQRVAIMRHDSLEVLGAEKTVYLVFNFPLPHMSEL